MLFFKRESKGRTDYGDVLLEALPQLDRAKLGAIDAQHVPQLHTVIDIAEPQMRNTLGFGEFLARGKSVSDAALAAAKQSVSPRDEAIVMYTSGTTSLPKGALLYHEGILHSARWSNSCIRLSEQDVYFTLQPIYHGGGAIGRVHSADRVWLPAGDTAIL